MIKKPKFDKLQLNALDSSGETCIYGRKIDRQDHEMEQLKKILRYSFEKQPDNNSLRQSVRTSVSRRSCFDILSCNNAKPTHKKTFSMVSNNFKNGQTSTVLQPIDLYGFSKTSTKLQLKLC